MTGPRPDVPDSAWARSVLTYLEQLWQRDDVDIPADPGECSRLMYCFFDPAAPDGIDDAEAPAWLQSLAVRFPGLTDNRRVRFHVYQQLQRMAGPETADASAEHGEEALVDELASRIRDALGRAERPASLTAELLEAPSLLRAERGGVEEDLARARKLERDDQAQQRPGQLAIDLLEQAVTLLEEAADRDLARQKYQEALAVLAEAELESQEHDRIEELDSRYRSGQ